MNKKLILITALVLLLISISAVSAEDINQTDDTLETSDDNVLSAGEEVRNFTSLFKDVENSQAIFDINCDYKFNNSTDKPYPDGIRIPIYPGATYTINGNNHVIDAQNQTGIFRFVADSPSGAGTVKINNLVFKNANTSAVILNDCILYTNNVTFERRGNICRSK